MNNINYSIENFRQNLYNIINESHLPVGIIYFILKDTLVETSQAYQTMVQKELMNNVTLKEEERNNGETISSSN